MSLRYINTRKPSTDIGSSIYHFNETELSFLESTDRMALRTDAGVVFLHLLSRETFFCFLFTFRASKIGNLTCIIWYTYFHTNRTHQVSRRIHQRRNRLLAEHWGVITSIINNTYTNGPPTPAFEANWMLAEDLKQMGLELQLTKSKCNIGVAHRNDKWEQLRGGIQNGKWGVEGRDGRRSDVQRQSIVRDDGVQHADRIKGVH